jgi:hypothetical protein
VEVKQVVELLKLGIMAINSGYPLKIGAITNKYVLPTPPLFPQKTEPPSFLKNTRHYQEEN